MISLTKLARMPWAAAATSGGHLLAEKHMPPESHGGMIKAKRSYRPC
jgi:hypothetical protein